MNAILTYTIYSDRIYADYSFEVYMVQENPSLGFYDGFDDGSKNLPKRSSSFEYLYGYRDAEALSKLQKTLTAKTD